MYSIHFFFLFSCESSSGEPDFLIFSSNAISKEKCKIIVEDMLRVQELDSFIHMAQNLNAQKPYILFKCSKKDPKSKRLIFKLL